MNKSEMVCKNCINGKVRQVGGVNLVNCFLNPETIVKSETDRCAQGDWREHGNNVRWWGAWDADDE